MQISSSGGGARNLGPVARRDLTSEGPPAVRTPRNAPARDAVAGEAPAAGGADSPSRGQEQASPSERLQAVTQRFAERLQSLLTRDDLTDQQRAELLEAKQAFEGLLGRLQGAMEGEENVPPEKAVRAFQHALDKLKDGVHAALGGAEGSEGALPAVLYGPRAEASNPTPPDGPLGFDLTV